MHRAEKVIRIAMYPAAFAAIATGLIALVVTWTSAVTYEAVHDQYLNALALSAGGFTMIGMLINTWRDDLTFRNVVRASIAFQAIFWILIGLGGRGDGGEPRWEWISLLWLFSLCFAATEMVRYAKR